MFYFSFKLKIKIEYKSTLEVHSWNFYKVKKLQDGF